MKVNIGVKLVLTFVAISIMSAGCSSNTGSVLTSQEIMQSLEETSALQEGDNNKVGTETVDKTVMNDTNHDGIVTIGCSLKTVSDERYSKEVKLIQQYADEMGAELLLQVANNDGALQVAQIENLLTQGIDVLMFNPIDESVLSSLMDEVHDAGIPILDYDYTIGNLYVDAYIGRYDIDLGRTITRALADLNISGNVVLIQGDIREGAGVQHLAEGMKMELEGCDINYVMEQYCDNWDASIAQAYAENALSKYGEDIAAFAVMNDGMAAGVASAVESAGLEGKIFITGMDGELSAFQRIANGEQLSTVLKPSDVLAREAVALAYKMGSGQELPEPEMTWDCGKTVCPFYLTDVILVTRDNLDEVVIESGLYTREEVYGH